MLFRKFGKLDWNVSVLGFGCMRLPTVDQKPLSPNIDEAEAIKMIRYAIDNGVNYLDTAYPYHNGNSEIILGKALKDGYRDKVKIATKSPIWFINNPEDFDKYLDEQLKKIQTNHIDFYLLHALDKHKWDNIVLKLDLFERIEAAIKSGKINHIGFSFHGKHDDFKPIIDGYDKWDFCQIQYNYMDTENQAGTQGLKYAASKGLAVVIMEPVLGGRLANPPQPIKEIFDRFTEKFSPADLALQWVWNHPEVAVVLSGMTSMQQVKKNLKSAEKSHANSLSREELNLIAKIQDKYKALTPIPCTKCGYCMPCPNGVNIPQNFGLYNDGSIHVDLGTPRFMYTRFMPENERASSCTQCRVCEEKCPQQIFISEFMPKVHAVLGEAKEYQE